MAETPEKKPQIDLEQQVGDLAHMIEQSQAQSASRARDAQLGHVIRDTPFMLTRCSRDLRYVFVSPAYAAMLGKAADELEGQSIVDVIGAAGFDAIRPFVDRVLAGERVEFTTEVPLAGIGPRSLRVVYTPDRAGDGAVAGWIASILDVSSEKAVSDARSLLANIVESSFDAIVTKDLNGIVTSWNAAAERLFGYTSGEMIGTPIRKLIPAERQTEEDNILARLRAGERIDHFQTIRVTKDGRQLHLSLTISPLRDSSGHVVGASKIARDITEMKQAEAERVRLLEENNAVTEALNRVGAVVASDLDRDRVVQAVTDTATELTTAEFGAFFYNVENEAGESYMLYTLSGVPREAFSGFPMPRNTAVFEPTFSGRGVVRSADITRDARYGHSGPHYGMPRGHLPVRSYLAVPVKGRSGAVLGGLFFGHSEVGRFTPHHERLAVGVASWASVALENARMYNVAQEASRLKDEFLASLSHELRTPLNAIVGYAHLFRTGMLGEDKQAHAIQAIERNARSLSQIVDDVLDVSRILSGKLRLDARTVDLPAIVGNALDAVGPAAEAKGVRLQSVLDPGAGPVSGDPERLQQVLWNLLSNAVKFTGRGGKVSVRLERVDSQVEVIVSDTGIGIAPAFLPHVFERFRQADAGTTRERGGLGLGLSIAKQLAEMHGGTITAASPGEGEGSTFTLTLPVMSVQPVSQPETGRPHPQTTVAAPSTPENVLADIRILVVDDDNDGLSLVAELLQATGAQVTAAGSAEAALQALAGGVPDVIVSDIGMPGIDGFQLIEQVRTHPDAAVRQIPAAALTAYARSEDRVKCLRAGFQMHLTKPIDPAELVSAVVALTRPFSMK